MAFFLNREPLLDPFLIERKGVMLIKEGICEYNSGNYLDAVNKFYTVIKYITYDFHGVDVMPFKRNGIFLNESYNCFSELYCQTEENNMLEIFSQQFSSLNIKKNVGTYDGNIYYQIVSGCFILTYSSEEETLVKLLDIVDKLNDIDLTPLSFYIKIKTLIRLDREGEFEKEFKYLFKALENLRTPNLRSYAAIRYLELFLYRKENSVDYLISLLRFYLSAPYSHSTINLLAKYQFENHLNIDFEVEVQPKIEMLRKGKNHEKYLSDLRMLISLLNKMDNNVLTPGEFLYNMILNIEPEKCNYESQKYLRIFYYLVSKKLEDIEDIRLKDFKKNNPDFDENDYIDIEEPYTNEDFINDVFEGDETNQWNID